MWVSEVVFQQSEAPDWVQEGQEDQTATWFFAVANGRYSLCGKRFWSRCKNMRKQNVPVAMKPYKTLKGVLVHPKKNRTKKLNRMCVQSSLCQLWQGETGRKFGVRLQEHRTEVESKTGCTFTRSLHASSLAEHNKSALTDHTAQKNHVINCLSDGDRQRATAFYQMDHA